MNPDNPENLYLTAGYTGGANLYAYCLNNPIMYTDSTGGFIDIILDAIFVVADLIMVAINPSAENLAALGADFGAMFIPFATGAGAGVHIGFAVARTADNFIDVGKGIDKLTDVGKVVDRVTDVSKMTPIHKVGYKIPNSGRMGHASQYTKKGYYYAKDIWQHGGSKYKVFTRSRNKLILMGDAAEIGGEIIGKHSSFAGRKFDIIQLFY